MKNTVCPCCAQLLPFEQEQCPACRTSIAFDFWALEFRVAVDQELCANRQLISCNWSTDCGSIYCPACRLTRTIPNLSSAKNILLWKRVEQAKRRLVYDLRRLKLPLATSGGTPIAFDILSEEATNSPIVTGHAAGVITISLAEADDVEREARRVALHEPYRTLLGHFRHEAGHFYWAPLISETGLTAPFRLIFGDETQDYGLALTLYHERANRGYDRVSYISEYATAHPWEDWAETFAHFLHIVSALDSIGGLPISLDSRLRKTLQDPYEEDDFGALISCWQPFAYSLNELNHALGQADAYPFELSRAVIGKLHFVHMALYRFRDQARRLGSDRMPS
jgi:hypothetical protein